MRGMPFSVQDKGGLLEIEVAATATATAARDYWKNIISASTTTTPTTNSSSSSSNKKRNYKGEGLEPRSVLDNRRSPSPSSSLGGGGGGGSTDTAGVAAVSDNTNPPRWPERREDQWASELQPIPHSAIDAGPNDKCLLGAGATEDWEAMLSDPPASPGQEQTFLRWIMGDIDDSSASKTHHHQMFSHPDFDSNNNSSLSFGSGMADAGFGFQAVASSVSAPFLNPVSLPPVPSSLPMFYQEHVEEKPLLFNPGLVLNNQQQQQQTQNPAFFLPLPQTDHHLIIPPPLKRHQSVSNSIPRPFPPQNVNPPVFPYQLHHQQQQQQQRPGKPKDENAAAAALAQQQQKALVDQLFKAAELVEAGNSPGAREILARLNHQLPPSPLGLKPLLRSAIYFKEVLQLLSTTNNGTPSPISNHWDVVLKLNAYKSFSEVSPFLHFANFTCTQTLLEELGTADRIHIVDFDIGVGGHWSSFMQELAHHRGTVIPVLKITAYVSPSSFHPLELHLTRQNLAHFAADLNIPFEFNILSIESFDPNELLAVSHAEAIGVNLPVGCHYNLPFPTLLRLVKQLGPKVVISVEHGCDRSDLSFSHSFLHSFQSCMVLLDSIDAAGTNSDIASKIERFLVQPRIEGAVIGRHRAVEKMHPWRGLFTSVGFMPVQFSNFTETQAECLLKRVQVRGFHVEKRHAALFLYWQRGELGSVSAWRC